MTNQDLESAGLEIVWDGRIRHCQAPDVRPLGDIAREPEPEPLHRLYRRWNERVLSALRQVYPASLTHADICRAHDLEPTPNAVYLCSNARWNLQLMGRVRPTGTVSQSPSPLGGRPMTTFAYVPQPGERLGFDD